MFAPIKEFLDNYSTYVQDLSIFTSETGKNFIETKELKITKGNFILVIRPLIRRRGISLKNHQLNLNKNFTKLFSERPNYININIEKLQLEIPTKPGLGINFGQVLLYGSRIAGFKNINRAHTGVSRQKGEVNGTDKQQLKFEFQLKKNPPPKSSTMPPFYLTTGIKFNIITTRTADRPCYSNSKLDWDDGSFFKYVVSPMSSRPDVKKGKYVKKSSPKSAEKSGIIKQSKLMKKSKSVDPMKFVNLVKK